MNALNFFTELKRRNVLRAAMLYAGTVWALAQGISQLGSALGLPDWTTHWFLIAAAIGFPFWIAFAWFYEFTPSGLRRESEIAPGDSIAHSTGRKLDKWIIAVLAVAVVLLLTDKLVRRDRVDQLASTPEKSLAGLPFVTLSDDKNNDSFADNVSEELLNVLGKVPGLKVTARTSAFYFKGKDVPIQEIGQKLGVATLVDGSVRKEGQMVRITARVGAFQIAEVYSGRGENDEAFAWLERARRQKDGGLAYFPNDPLLDPLKADSRSAAFERKMGSARDQLK